MDTRNTEYISAWLVFITLPLLMSYIFILSHLPDQKRAYGVGVSRDGCILHSRTQQHIQPISPIQLIPRLPIQHPLPPAVEKSNPFPLPQTSMTCLPDSRTPTNQRPPIPPSPRDPITASANIYRASSPEIAEAHHITPPASIRPSHALTPQPQTHNVRPSRRSCRRQRRQGLRRQSREPRHPRRKERSRALCALS